MEPLILFVDDEIELIEMIKEDVLAIHPEYQIVCYQSAYTALQRIMQGGIDLVLTDIAMPDLDGYELFSRIKEYNENLPVIMMTGFGYDPNHIIVRSRQNGLQDVLMKPFDVERLVGLIEKRLETYRSQHE